MSSQPSKIGMATKMGTAFTKGIVKAYLLTNEKDVLGGIRNYVIGRLKEVQPDLFAGAIASNTLLWTQIPEGYMNLIQNLAHDPEIQKVIQKYSGMITVPLFLSWLHSPTGKPDDKLSTSEKQLTTRMREFESIIQNWPNGQGIIWLQTNIESIQNGFKLVIQS